MMKYYYPLLFCLLAMTNCGQNEPTPPPSGTPSAPINGTAKMIKLLNEAYGKIDPMKLKYYYSSFRAEQFKFQAKNSQDINEQMNNKLQYAHEALNAGKNEEAVKAFEELYGAGEQAGVPKEIQLNVKRQMALSYVRLGESANCIQRYNPASCIMPIKGKGVYTMTQASQTAVQLYEELLAENPDDYESIWMLNFAYMTLGEYPEKVPAKWRLPEASFRSDYDIPVFKNIADKIGVGTVALSGGACVDDFNNDGLLDIFASSWGPSDQLRLYTNNGDGTFSEKTQDAGLAGLIGGLNILHADYNNDGWLDLLVLRGAWYKEYGKIPNSLLKNNGDGTFTDVTEEAGILSYAPTQTSVWADFNKDGWLDLFIGNESQKSYRNPCEFYLSNRDGTFTNKAVETGFDKLITFIKGCTAGDINNDGWPDLYISVFGGPNILLQNNGLRSDGHGVNFVNISQHSNTQDPIAGFPCWMFDFNNDGWEDILAAAYGTQEGRAAYLAALNHLGKTTEGAPSLYLNNKNGSFTDIALPAGMDEAMFVMGSNYGDLDNDGWLDCYLATGTPNFTSIVPNKMFRNHQGKSVQDVTTAGGFGHVQKGHGVGFGDFDNDGDQDIFAVIGGAYEGDVFGDAFFLNPYGNEKSWVTLKLIGTTANRSAIGARVKVVSVLPSGQEQVTYATVSTGSSFGGNSLQLELGLGDATSIKSIEVTWPNREQTVGIYQNIQVKKFVKITEGAEAVEYVEPKQFGFEG